MNNLNEILESIELLKREMRNEYEKLGNDLEKETDKIIAEINKRTDKGLSSIKVKFKAVSADEVVKARLSAQHTQAEAAALVGFTTRAWRSWEAGDRVMRRSVLNQYLDLTLSARHSENAVKRGSAKEAGQE